MRRILFVDHHAELGGGEIALFEIIKNLDKQKFSPLVLLGNDGPFLEILKKEGIEVIVDKLPLYFRKLERSPEASLNIFSYVKSAFNLPVFIKRTENTIKKYNIDTVYINTIKSLLYAAKAAKRLNVRIIWHLHDCLSSDFYPSWAIPTIIKLSRFADRVICVSNVVRDAYIKAKGDDKKAVVIYNGIDIERFNPRINAEDTRKKLNIKDERIVSAIGRLEEWKGQKIFIRAAEIICSRRQDIIFLIAGGPLFGCEKYEQELKQMVRDLGLEGKVFLLSFRNDPESIIAISDIIIHPSIKPEPFGRDIIEAMACAKPVISTNVGATPEIIEDGKDAILIEPDNPDILAKRIMDLLYDKEKRKVLSASGRKKVEDIFDIRKITKQIEELL